jgi:hypothetical protein
MSKDPQALFPWALSAPSGGDRHGLQGDLVRRGYVLLGGRVEGC